MCCLDRAALTLSLHRHTIRNDFLLKWVPATLMPQHHSRHGPWHFLHRVCVHCVHHRQIFTLNCTVLRALLVAPRCRLRQLFGCRQPEGSV